MEAILILINKILDYAILLPYLGIKPDLIEMTESVSPLRREHSHTKAVDSTSIPKI